MNSLQKATVDFKDKSFSSSVNQIYQTFDGKELYPTLEEKVAMLLYLITKNHSFSDGNKRIAAALFLYFLDKNNALFIDGKKIIDDYNIGSFIYWMIMTINRNAILELEEKVNSNKKIKTNLIKYQEDNGEETTLAGFLEEISLITDIDNYDNEADSVVLMTMHSAKGLEFPVVFVPGMEDGIFPSVQAIYDDCELQEERRLAYVAITRAKEELYLIKSKSRMIFGTTKHNRVSRFATEIPPEFVEETWTVLSPEKQAIVDNAKPKVSFMASAAAFNQPVISAAKNAAKKPAANISSGDTVRHPTFGKGVVLNALKVGNDTLLEIMFDNVGTKKLMANFGNLEKLS